MFDFVLILIMTLLFTFCWGCIRTDEDEEDDDDMSRDENEWADTLYVPWPRVRNTAAHVVVPGEEKGQGDPLGVLPLELVFPFWCLAGGDVQAAVTRSRRHNAYAFVC